MFGFWNDGLWTREVNRFYAWSLPSMVVAVLLGRVANRRLQGRRFYCLIFVGLALLGVALLAEAFRQ